MVHNIDYLNPVNINGLNLFAYCNNAIMYVDPSGHIALWLLCGLIIGGIGLIASETYAGIKSYENDNRERDLARDIAIGSLIGGTIGFIGGSLIGAFASGALAGQFTAGVKDVIKGGIRVYQMARYGGTTAAGLMMFDNLYNSFNYTQHIFWSGGTPVYDSALSYAEKTGGTTLEMTGLGGYLSVYFSGASYNPLAWNIASQNFASQVTYGGTVRAILYYPYMREAAIWFSEANELAKRLVEIIIGGL